LVFFREKQHLNVGSLLKIFDSSNLPAAQFQNHQSHSEKIFAVVCSSGKYGQFTEPIQRENLNSSPNGIR
jgi:hypothetical protein